MRAVDLDTSSGGLLAPVCRSCTWWQRAEAGGDGGPAVAAGLRSDWERRVEAEAGFFGRVLLDGDDVLGWMHAAPSALVPRAAGLPAGPPTGDAWLLLCAYFYEEEFLHGFQFLLQDVISALKQREIAALEAFAVRDPGAGERFCGYLRALNLFNPLVLEGTGFRRVRSGTAVGRYRLELATLVSEARLAHAARRRPGPATIPA